LVLLFYVLDLHWSKLPRRKNQSFHLWLAIVRLPVCNIHDYDTLSCAQIWKCRSCSCQDSLLGCDKVLAQVRECLVLSVNICAHNLLCRSFVHLNQIHGLQTMIYHQTFKNCVAEFTIMLSVLHLKLVLLGRFVALLCNCAVNSEGSGPNIS
jgi:hypothetical protein